MRTTTMRRLLWALFPVPAVAFAHAQEPQVDAPGLSAKAGGVAADRTAITALR